MGVTKIIRVYQEGLEDAQRAIARGKVIDPKGKVAERMKKCDQGDIYSCGVRDALEQDRVLRMEEPLLALAGDFKVSCGVGAVYRFRESAEACLRNLERKEDLKIIPQRYTIQEARTPSLLVGTVGPQYQIAAEPIKNNNIIYREEDNNIIIREEPPISRRK